MTAHTRDRLQYRLMAGLFLIMILLFGPVESNGQSWSADDCLMCHSDPQLEASDGDIVGVSSSDFFESVHGEMGFACVDCHDQPSADWEDMPHFDVYHPVNCGMCHAEAEQSYEISFHGQALASGEMQAPECASCHGTNQNAHRIKPVGTGVAESACRVCHRPEAQAYRGSVHQVAHDAGKPSPGCATCHPTHGAELPPAAGAVNKLCTDCHTHAMETVEIGGHPFGETEMGVINCASCHDVHSTHIPEVDTGTLQACVDCHEGYQEQFAGSVHEDLFENDGMNCLSCHKTHQITDTETDTDFGCGQCHTDAEEVYRTSAHRMARLHGDVIAAECADCHAGHHILPASDPDSRVNHRNIPETCGECHTDNTVITQDYVRLPISLPSYSQSVHGKGLQEGKLTAVCTDCHGSHNLQSANIPTSMVARQNLTQTCGQCHDDIANTFSNSVHGRAVQHGIKDSPDCTGCHDEHLILETDNPESPVNPARAGSIVCQDCHEDAEMAAKYGLTQGVVSTYMDSYHGWALQRGGGAVAACEDCHMTHDIRSAMDPQSTIHPDNVVTTCAQCHPQSNPTFARSYSHVAAAGKWMVHDYVRVVYIVLILVVLGGMLVHNLIIFIKEMRKDYGRHLSEPAVKRMNRSEIGQHLILAITFIGLAITGFALRFPEAWWVEGLKIIGMTEELRRILHRIFAVALIFASIYHIFYLMLTSRGRMLFKAIFPGLKDAKRAVQQMAYYVGLRKQPPVHGMFDYTQKAEYWALIWGTVVMGITGIVLWFPDLLTSWLPAWTIRVSETIHFYEAILAVGAIIVWHFFFTIFLPREYPMSWIWITGRMEKEDWEHHHREEIEETGQAPEMLPPENGKTKHLIDEESHEEEHAGA